MNGRELAKCRGFDFGIEDHGIPVLHGVFEGEGWGQGLGLHVDIDFLKRFLAVFGVERLQQVNGRPCWVTHDNVSISRIEPLFPKEGKTFHIENWVAEKRREAERAQGQSARKARAL